MTDFGRKDFSAALSRMFGEAKASAMNNPDADEIDGFKASKSAKVADSGELERMEGGIDTLLNDFETRWNQMKDTLRSQVQTVIVEMERFAAANSGLSRNDTATTDADAERAALGGTRDQVADKFARVAAAGGRDRTTTAAGNVSKLSASDIDAGLEPGANTTPGAADDVAASQIQGARVERQRRTGQRAAARLAAKTQGGA